MERIVKRIAMSILLMLAVSVATACGGHDSATAGNSYCRLLTSVIAQSKRTQGLQPTGVPDALDEIERLQAAVRLLDDAVAVAPDEIGTDLETFREAMRQDALALAEIRRGESRPWSPENGGSYRAPADRNDPEYVAERKREMDAETEIVSYNERVCGLSNYLLGSLD
jgi:hypothetical protein